MTPRPLRIVLEYAAGAGATPTTSRVSCAACSLTAGFLDPWSAIEWYRAHLAYHQRDATLNEPGG